MPNHIQNKLTITGENCEVVLKSIKSKGTTIDFNKIVPRPKELDLTAVSNVEGAVKNALNIKVVSGVYEPMSFSDEDWSNFIQQLQNMRKYGHCNWYSWSCDKWGTKWNAYGTKDERDNGSIIYFQTAWSTPYPVIEKLSEKFPDNGFELQFADEDTGSNTGIIVFESGKVVSEVIFENGSKEAYENYFELWGGQEDYVFNGTTYDYKEDDEE